MLEKVSARRSALNLVEKVLATLQDYRITERLPFSALPARISHDVDKTLPASTVCPRLLFPRLPGPSSSSILPSPEDQLPNVGELWEELRLWGTLRHLAVERNCVSHPYMVDGEDVENSQVPILFSWKIRVSFCYEDEAQRFEDADVTLCGWAL